MRANNRLNVLLLKIFLLRSFRNTVHRNSSLIALSTLYVHVAVLWCTRRVENKWQSSFNKARTARRILHILLFQEAIQVTIVKFLIEEFTLDYRLYVHIFIDEYVLIKKVHASFKIFCIEKMHRGFPRL